MYPKNQKNCRTIIIRGVGCVVRGRWIQVGDHEVMKVERCEVGLSGGWKVYGCCAQYIKDTVIVYNVYTSYLVMFDMVVFQFPYKL